MKLLYGVQGSGNGHVARAQALVPFLENHMKVDLLVSGNQTEMSLPKPAKYVHQGLNLVFGKNGGIGYRETLSQTKLDLLFKEIRGLDLSNYDLVLSDFEPLSAWAARNQGVPCVHLSNQAALLHPQTPRTGVLYPFAYIALKYMAPANHLLPISYTPHSDNHIFPLIRKAIRSLDIYEDKHHLVYLPAYADNQVYEVLKAFPNHDFKIFSKKSNLPYFRGNCRFYPVNETEFLHALRGCKGVISAAGFALTSEVMYLGKKLLAIPMKGQYEQACNAKSIEALGGFTLPKLHEKFIPDLETWLERGTEVKLNWEDPRPKILNRLLEIGSQSEKILAGI